jgi:hypothetical protein
VPEFEENDWELAGYATEADFQLDQADWERVAESFARMTESFARIQAAVQDAQLSINSFRGDDMAVDIRRSEYPMTDGYGTYWYDPSGMHSNEPGECFMCKKLTNRIDIDFHGYFCDSDECNEQIRIDLEMANSEDRNRTEDDQ